MEEPKIKDDERKEVAVSEKQWGMGPFSVT